MSLATAAAIACVLIGCTAEGSESSPAPAAEQTTTTRDGDIERTSVRVAGGEVALVELRPPGASATVLFLHGAAYDAETWVDNGILAAVADAGIDAIAIDLPGTGRTNRVDIDPGQFLAAFFEAAGLEPDRTVVVSPSMSGIYALPALRDAALADLAGSVFVAPSGAGSFADDGPAVSIPGLLIWGDQDGSDPEAAAGRLGTGFEDATVVILADAGHAAYQQQPQLFTAELLAFTARVTG